MTEKPASGVTITSPAQPVQPGERIEFVDILRGFALFGVLAMNMSGFAGYQSAASYTEPLARGIMIGLLFLVQAKFYSLFSLLFGWGMAVQLRRSRQGFIARYSRRLLILLAFGALHGAFLWRGDILFFYAALGFLLLGFRKSPGWLLLCVAGLSLAWSILLQAPWGAVEDFRAWYEGATSFLRTDGLQESLYASGDYATITRLRWQDFVNGNSYFIYYIGNVFAMFLLGLFIGKRRLFESIYQHRRLLYITLFTGLVLGASLNGFFTYASFYPERLPEAYRSMLLVGSRTLGAPALTLFYVSLLIILVEKKNWYQHLAPLAPMGRMALTNYLLQSVLAGLVFYGYGLGLYGESGPVFGLFLTLVIYIFEVRFSAWWFERFQYGPVEWLWRTLTYGRRQPLRVGVTPEELKSWHPGERIHNFIRRLNPWLVFALIWGLLSIWTIALVVGNLRLAARTPESLTIVVRITATPAARESNRRQSESDFAEVGEDLAAEYLALPATPGRSLLDNLGANPAALASGFDVSQAMIHIDTLSSSDYAGRHAGSPGGRAAGDYIAAAFERYGLLPAGEDGSYFQEFLVLYTPLAGVPQLRVTSPAGIVTDTYRLYQDYLPVVRWYSGSGSGAGRVAWMDDCGSEDFLGAQVVGMVVMCSIPQRPHWLEESTRTALEHGAAGLLLLSDPEISPADFSIPTKEQWVPRPLPTFRVYPHLVADILAGSGWTLDALIASGAPQFLETDVLLEISTQDNGTCPGPACTARNVLGVIPGRDPEVAHQVVVLGAHYDHMGQGPDGTYWAGANDDASGVGVLLEIARSWQAAGYQPRRTILFAAWDAEELGLLGARYYTSHPRLLLEDTRAMIQLDMVGAPAEELSVGGTTDLEEQLAALAVLEGLPVQLVEPGGSDNVPFLERGIPAAALFYYDPEKVREHYHRPADLPQVIDQEKMAAIGRITYATLVNLADSEPAIERLLIQRATALREGDWDALQAITTREQQVEEAAWLSDLNQLNPISVTLSTRDLAIHGNQAVVKSQVTAQYLAPGADPVTQTLRIVQSARLSYQAGAWLWDGPDLLEVPADALQTDSETNFRVHVPARREAEGVAIAARLAEQYAFLAGQLGLSPISDSQLLLFADRAALRASVGISQPDDLALWVTPGKIKLAPRPENVDNQLLLQAAAQLLLANYGLDSQSAPWLWHGLSLALAEEAEPGTWQPRFLPTLLSGFQAAEGEKPSEVGEQARAWAAVRYLRGQVGWEGLGRFITSLGQACQAGLCSQEGGRNPAFLEATGQDEQQFERNWQAHWRQRLFDVQAALDRLLASRSSALSERDLNTWLGTVDGNVPELLAAETAWWQAALLQTARTFHWQATPVLLDMDDSVIAAVEFLAEVEGQSEPISLGTSRIRFQWTSEGYRWSGAPLETHTGNAVTLRVPAGETIDSQAWLAATEALYASLASELGMEPRPGIGISLYPDPEALSLSISPPQGPLSYGRRQWTAPGQGIKLVWGGIESGFESLRDEISTQLALNLLYQAGLQEPWLLQGISNYVSHKNPGAAGFSLIAELPQLQALAQAGDLPALFELPVAEVGDINVGGGAQRVVNETQAWDVVRFLVDHYGSQALADLVVAHQEGRDAEGALQVVTGITPQAFEVQWRESLLNGHIEPAWQATAGMVNGEQAMAHVDFLASEKLAGRAAGSAGEAAAASYIAAQFQALGLLPVHQLALPAGALSDTLTSIGSMPVDSLAGFLQTFPISPTALVAPPRFELNDESGRTMVEFFYRDEFLGLRPAEEPAGQAAGEMVLVAEGGFTEADLAGRIAVLWASADLETDLKLARENGAQGMIYLGSKREPEDLYARQFLAAEDVSEIPVLELTQPGVSRFLEALGSDRDQFRQLPNGTILSLSASLNYRTNQPRETLSANVLGYLPGSDPQLSQELIILGAHYDHVGNEGDLRYSGANDNASGVAVLLEIARAWQQSGYRPKRSVLFAAWGSQELGELGSSYYLAHPAWPRQKTIAMLQVDGVGGGDGFKLGAQGDWEEDGLWLFALQSAAQMVGDTIVIVDQESESDHMPFHAAGLPVALVTWRLANEDNLPDGLAQAVHPDRLVKTGEIIALAAMSLAR